jgi:hypothetical protein
MSNIAKDVKKAIKIVGGGGVVLYLTTVSNAGIPNVVGERFVTLFKDRYILIAEMFAQKTRVNINENPHGIITLAHPVKGRTWLFKGPVTILQEGLPDDYVWKGLSSKEALEEWGDWALREPPSEVPPDIRPPVLVQRGVIAFKIEEAYNFAPEHAGEQFEF